MKGIFSVVFCATMYSSSFLPFRDFGCRSDCSCIVSSISKMLKPFQMDPFYVMKKLLSDRNVTCNLRCILRGFCHLVI